MDLVPMRQSQLRYCVHDDKPLAAFSALAVRVHCFLFLVLGGVENRPKGDLARFRNSLCDCRNYYRTRTLDHDIWQQIWHTSGTQQSPDATSGLPVAREQSGSDMLISETPV